MLGRALKTPISGNPWNVGVKLCLWNCTIPLEQEPWMWRSALGHSPCSSALHILPSPGTGPELGHTLRGSPTDSSPLSALNVTNFSPGIGIIPFSLCTQLALPLALCCPGCWGLQPSGCSQCFNFLGTAQARERKGSSVLPSSGEPPNL